MKNKVLHILKKIKKPCVIAALMAFCFMGLSGCQNEKEVLYDDSVSEDSPPEILIEKKSPVCILGEWSEPYEKVLVQYESILKEEDEDPGLMNDDTGHEYVGTRYYCLEADDPKVQEYIIGDAGEDGFVCGSFIKGLAGFSPESDSSGGITYYTKDKEIIIENNVGQGLLQSQRLAEVKENIREMVMDIIRERGRNARDYQEYFADEALLQQIETYLDTEVEEDWMLLESFYLSDYAGNTEEIYWYNKSETTWRDIENETTKRLTETDTMYHFEFSFYADYRTMEYGKYDKAAAIYFTCAVSKETGLIEEISISKFYTHKFDFETMRWT